jgi:hypothetical protein
MLDGQLSFTTASALATMSMWASVRTSPFQAFAGYSVPMSRRALPTVPLLSP